VSVVAVAEAQEWLNLSGQYEYRLQAVIDAAEAAISRRVGPLEPTVFVDETVTATTGGGLILKNATVVEVTSATSNGTTTDITGWVLDGPAGLVATSTTYGYGYGYGCGPAYVVTYTAGWAVLPADLRLAVLEMIRHLWSSTQRGAGAGRVIDRGEQVSDGGRAFGGPSYLLPYVVESLIEPFTLVTVA
jgi:hypothetical protein